MWIYILVNLHTQLPSEFFMDINKHRVRKENLKMGLKKWMKIKKILLLVQEHDTYLTIMTVPNKQ